MLTSDWKIVSTGKGGSRAKSWVNGYPLQTVEQCSYGNLEEVVGDWSGEWQGGTHLPLWGVRRLGTPLPRLGRDWTQEEKPADDRESW